MRTADKPQASNIPFAAFMNLLGQLSTQAAIEANGLTDDHSVSYLEDAGGNHLVDASSSVERAELLLEILHENTLENYLPQTTEGIDPLAEWFVSAGLIQ